MNCVYYVFSVVFVLNVVGSLGASYSAKSSELGIVKCNISPNHYANKYRTADGTCNNLMSEKLILSGATGEKFERISKGNSYSDNIKTPTPNVSPRKISNEICSQNSVIPNEFSGSDLLPFFGQFIDHDLDLTAEGTEKMNIQMPKGDCLGNNHCPKFIPFSRSKAVRECKTCINQYRNELTSFLDLSSIYGSTKKRAARLRSFSKGLMKTSTVDGEIFLPLNKDVNVPMAKNTPNSFGAGDFRANEHLVLIALTTLFVREHNRLAVEYKRLYPKANDEKIYQEARKRNIAQYQSIVFDEWLPAVLGDKAVEEYIGYYVGHKGLSKPDISLEFATAVFRWGHSAISDVIPFYNTKGIKVKELKLVEAFFRPEFYKQNKHHLDWALIGITKNHHQAIDVKVVNGLRQGLFQTVEKPHDLVSINIQRGRDHGMGSLNDLKESVKLPLVANFNEMCGKNTLSKKLNSLYKNVKNCDLWVCGLAESKYPGSQLGKTFTKTMALQFKNLRDGDRFYWERHPGLSSELNLPIKIADIYRRNIPGFVGPKDLFHVNSGDDTEEAYC